MNKVFPDARSACADIPDGATIFVGGFGLAGIPEECIAAVRDLGPKNLTVISNNAGTTDHGLVHLLKNRQVHKMISSYVGENQVFEQQMLAGEIQVELTPQGTMSERIRAGGAGIPAFFTPTGVGTRVAEGKEVREFDGRRYVMERGLTGDFALVKAWKGDRLGNLVYRKTARNFNPMMAMAGRITIAEVEHLVEP
ncbi:MAG TPA: CoA transferase subunit A, partial [Gemmatimonadales bacterium]